jgi:alpha-tubulin suppressor-like RCC1 family protein
MIYLPTSGKTTIKNAESLQLSDATGSIFEMLNARDQLDLLVTERCAILPADGLREIASQLSSVESTPQQSNQSQERPAELGMLSRKLQACAEANTYAEELRAIFAVEKTTANSTDDTSVSAPVMRVTDSARLFVQAFQLEQTDSDQAAMSIQSGQHASRHSGDSSGLVARINVNGVACLSSDISRSPQALMTAQLLLSDKSLPPSRARQLADEYMDVVRKWYTAPFRQHTVTSAFAAAEGTSRKGVNVVQVPALSREARVVVDVHVGVGLYGGGWGLGVRLRVETAFTLFAAAPSTRRRQLPFTQTQPTHSGRLAKLVLKVENACLVRTLLARGLHIRAALSRNLTTSDDKQLDGKSSTSELAPLSPSNDISTMLHNNTAMTIRLVGVSNDVSVPSSFQHVSLLQFGAKHGEAVIASISPSCSTSAADIAGAADAAAPQVRRRLKQIPRAEQHNDSKQFAAYSWLLSKGANTAIQSPSTEANEIYRPGQQDDEATVNGFNSVLLPGLVDLVRVAKVCCSWYHTAALTDVGIVFTWGNGADGALGHGDTDTRHMPTAVDALLDIHPPVLISDIACGSNLVGAHTTAVSTKGEVYTWGTPTALGLGAQHAAQPASPLPQLINPNLFTRKAWGGPMTDAVGQRNADEQDIDNEEEGESAIRGPNSNGGNNAEDQYGDNQVVAIACGGGFTVATTAAGAVFTWGQWANGRLGLGKAPIFDKRATAANSGSVNAKQKQQEQNKGSQKRQRVQRYQLSPRWLCSLGRITVSDAMCGDGHVVALTSAGELYTWGKNSFGQLGNGHVKDQLLPGKLTRFLGAEPTAATLHFLDKKTTPVFVKVTCGSFHSAALSSTGLLYTWGAGGSSTLGHGDPDGGASSSTSTTTTTSVPLDALNGNTTSTGRATTKAMAKVAAAQLALQGSGVETNEHVYLVHTQPWRWPRAVYFFARNNIRVSQMSAGVQHMAVVSTDQGSTFVWGDPKEKKEFRFARVREKVNESSRNDVTTSRTSTEPLKFPADPTLLLHQNQRNTSQVWGYGGGETAVVGGMVDTLTEDICVDQVVCGGWQILVSTLGSRLGRELFAGYRRAQKQAPSTSLMSNNNHDAEHWLNGADSESGEQGLTDLRIVVGNRVIRAHAVVVAARCPTLAHKMDLAKLSAANENDTIQVMMPDVSVKVALLMLDFMYGENVTTRLDPTSPLGVALGTAAADYGMPALAILCKQAVMDPSLIGEVDGDDERVLSDANGEDGMLVVPRTLKHDMGFYVNNEKWANVQLIAESGDDRRILHSHEFILQSRSEYLKNALSSLDAAPDDVSRRLVKRLYMPETRPCILDLLWYLYTGSLAHIATPDRMISLWVAADRYGLYDLKLRCEASLRLTVTNCCRLLQISAVMRNSTLITPAIAFAAKNLAKLESTRAFSVLWRLYPQVVAEIVKTRQGWASSDHAPGMAWADDGLVVDANGVAVRDGAEGEGENNKDENQQELSRKTEFPWAVTAALVMLFAGSLMLTKLDPALLRYVPFANGLMLIACVTYCAKYLSGA